MNNMKLYNVYWSEFNVLRGTILSTGVYTVSAKEGNIFSVSMEYLPKRSTRMNETFIRKIVESKWQPTNQKHLG